MTAKKTATPQPEQEESYYPEVKTLLEWKAPGRPFRKRQKSYFATSLLIMFFLEIILFLFSQYMLMLVVVSFVFVAFALAIVPPHDFNYRLSTEGIFVEDHFFIWSELYDFYFKKRDGQDILYIHTHAFIPGILTITLADVSVEKIKKILLNFLPFREYVHPTFMERAGEWLNKTFPLEIAPQQ